MTEVKPPIQPADSIIPSLIRTYVPIIVGQIAGFLATKGLELDTTTQTALIAFLGGLITAIYYTLVRLLERKYPKLSFLLGSSTQPTYIEQ